ncbi:DUF2231 domain-containing protein [Nocardioides solisilvae]|uniref:DUF2231 domain-containing protein n=1 Tax=Nocardioides solisilvae TaxID=1542435 RepID=UPI000D74DF91|nr:DUF2231 domain-containing protein [Nocardioides solisilvae]
MATTSSHPLVRATQALERSERLDPLVGFYQPFADALVGSEGRRRLLQGDWLGHAIHPLMTDVPIGMWTSATVLDLVGGERSRPAAELLVAGGLAASLPTALAGWAEWHRSGRSEKRVGVVHAFSNVAAIGLYGASLAARRRGSHLTGVALGLAGSTAMGVGGYLGGHLAAVRKVSSRHPDFEADALA